MTSSWCMYFNKTGLSLLGVSKHRVIQIVWALIWLNELQSKASGCISYSHNIVPNGINMHGECQFHGPLTRYVNCELRMRRECRERFPRHRLQRKPLVRYPGMHHGTCVTHVPWCMSGYLTRGGGETFPAFPAHAQHAILRIWQEAHWQVPVRYSEQLFLSYTDMFLRVRLSVPETGRLCRDPD